MCYRKTRKKVVQGETPVNDFPNTTESTTSSFSDSSSSEVQPTDPTDIVTDIATEKQREF